MKHTLRGYILPTPGMVDVYRLTADIAGLEALDHLLGSQYPCEQLYHFTILGSEYAGTRDQVWLYLSVPGHHGGALFKDYYDDEPPDCTYEEFLKTIDFDYELATHEIDKASRKVLAKIYKRITWLEDNPYYI